MTQAGIKPAMYYMNVAHVVPPKLGIIQNKLHKSLKLLNLHRAVCILMQSAVILSTCHIVRTS